MKILNTSQIGNIKIIYTENCVFYDNQCLKCGLQMEGCECNGQG